MKGRVKEQKGIEYYMQLPYSILLHEIEDEGEKYWIAEVPELPGCKSHGSTIDQAVKNVEEAKKDWILDSLEDGDEIPTPIERDRFSGKTLVRMSRSLHRALSLVAESEKLSLNQLIVTILAKEVGRLGVLNRVEEKLDNLLDRVNDVLQREELTIARSINLSSLITEPYKQEEYEIIVDTSPVLGTPAAAGVKLIYTGPSTPAAVSTASPLDELWSYPYRNYQGLGSDRIFLYSHKEKESEPENVVELKQK